MGLSASGVPDMASTEKSMGLQPPAQALLQSVLDWQGAVGKSVVLAGFYPWPWLLAWQRAFGAVQRECVDQWICRFGGGVPLDG